MSDDKKPQSQGPHTLSDGIEKSIPAGSGDRFGTAPVGGPAMPPTSLIQSPNPITGQVGSGDKPPQSKEQ